jgi:hypothetical protein
MKVFIPPLGTKMVLTQNWHFNLPDDSQNEPLIRELKAAPAARIRAPAHTNPTWPAMLPAGTELIIRTIDVRQAQNGWEKIAFSVRLRNGKQTRFFVRGAEANKIDVTVEGIEEKWPVDAAVTVINHVLDRDNDDNDYDKLQFLRLWNEGEFEVLRREWPEAPEAIYIGADPLFRPAAKNKSG